MSLKQLYIFDLDHTLCLWWLGPACRAAYESRLRVFLKRLLNEGHVLTVASFNQQAEAVLSSMGLLSLFHLVVTGRSEKVDLVVHICNLFPQITKENVHFFDDDDDSVIAVRAHGINGINVAPLTGIRMD